MTAPASPKGSFNNPVLTTILFAIMVKRLGGKVTITQTDIDDVAYNRLDEDGCDDGSLEFRLVQRNTSA